MLFKTKYIKYLRELSFDVHRRNEYRVLLRFFEMRMDLKIIKPH